MKKITFTSFFLGLLLSLLFSSPINAECYLPTSNNTLFEECAQYINMTSKYCQNEDISYACCTSVDDQCPEPDATPIPFPGDWQQPCKDENGLPACNGGLACTNVVGQDLDLCCVKGNSDCTQNPLEKDIPVYSICNGLTGDEKRACEDCLGKNGTQDHIWTALGCISSDPVSFISDFLKIALGIAGGIALLLMIYGSFLISTSAGEPKKAEEGKEMITGTIAGLLFIIFSVFLLRLIGVDILQIPGF